MWESVARLGVRMEREPSQIGMASGRRSSWRWLKTHIQHSLDPDIIIISLLEQHRPNLSRADSRRASWNFVFLLKSYALWPVWSASCAAQLKSFCGSLLFSSSIFFFLTLCYRLFFCCTMIFSLLLQPLICFFSPSLSSMCENMRVSERKWRADNDTNSSRLEWNCFSAFFLSSIARISSYFSNAPPHKSKLPSHNINRTSSSSWCFPATHHDSCVASATARRANAARLSINRLCAFFLSSYMSNYSICLKAKVSAFLARQD